MLRFSTMAFILHSAFIILHSIIPFSAIKRKGNVSLHNSANCFQRLFQLGLPDAGIVNDQTPLILRRIVVKLTQGLYPNSGLGQPDCQFFVRQRRIHL